MRTPGSRPGRALGLCCVALLAAAGAFFGVAGLGASSGTGLGLFALAGGAALVALGGWARRGVGALLVLAGVVGTIVIMGDGAGRPDAGGVLVDAAAGGAVAGVLALAVIGGAATAGTGLVVLLAEPRLARFGARYAGPAHRPPPDPDRAAWEALDAGADPTAGTDPADPAGTDPAGADPTAADPAGTDPTGAITPPGAGTRRPTPRSTTHRAPGGSGPGPADPDGAVGRAGQVEPGGRRSPRAD